MIDVETGNLHVSGDGAATMMNTGELHAVGGTTIFLDRVTLATGTTFTGGAGQLQFNGTAAVTKCSTDKR